jgi:hypothetical protein
MSHFVAVYIDVRGGIDAVIIEIFFEPPTPRPLAEDVSEFYPAEATNMVIGTDRDVVSVDTEVLIPASDYWTLVLPSSGHF